MTKHQRLLELVRIILDDRDADFDERFAVIDCIMSLPDGSIPDSKSLRDFALAITDYFFDISTQCRLSYPKAARYIRRWRRVWLPDPPPPRADAHELN